MKRPSRTLTTAAVGFLALDAVLFGYGGVELHRVSLLLAGGACALVAVLVVVGWRRYRHALEELEVAHREMREDIEAIRGLLHDRHQHN